MPSSVPAGYHSRPVVTSHPRQIHHHHATPCRRHIPLYCRGQSILVGKPSLVVATWGPLMPMTEILLSGGEKMNPTFDRKISTHGSTVAAENKAWDFPINTENQ